jgi:hypothetical protein
LRRAITSYDAWTKQARPAGQILQELIAEDAARSGPLDALTRDVRERLFREYAHHLLALQTWKWLRDILEFVVPISFGLFALGCVIVRFFTIAR